MKGYGAVHRWLQVVGGLKGGFLMSFRVGRSTFIGVSDTVNAAVANTRCTNELSSSPPESAGASSVNKSFLHQR